MFLPKVKIHIHGPEFSSAPLSLRSAHLLVRRISRSCLIIQTDTWSQRSTDDHPTDGFISDSPPSVSLPSKRLRRTREARVHFLQMFFSSCCSAAQLWFFTLRLEPELDSCYITSCSDILKVRRAERGLWWVGLLDFKLFLQERELCELRAETCWGMFYICHWKNLTNTACYTASLPKGMIAVGGITVLVYRIWLWFK